MNNLYHKSLNRISIILLSLVILSTSIFINFQKREDVQSTFLEEVSNDIIPKPLSYVKNNGKFILSKESSIYIKGKNKEETEEIRIVAEFLREKLISPTGYELKIVEGDNPP